MPKSASGNVRPAPLARHSPRPGPTRRPPPIPRRTAPNGRPNLAPVTLLTLAHALTRLSTDVAQIYGVPAFVRDEAAIAQRDWMDGRDVRIALHRLVSVIFAHALDLPAELVNRAWDAVELLRRPVARTIRRGNLVLVRG